MTGWGVERRPRTAHRPSPVSPAGVFTLMPLPSQGAERRTERHAARTGSRWGILPVAVDEYAVASHRLPLATDVTARQHDAEAQTASPD